METVSVSALKAHLSRYLRTVKRGGEVQVIERGVPVARMVGLAPGSADAERWRRLARAGVLRPGAGDPRWILKQKPIRLKGGALTEALREEREDRV